ncbi:Ig domain-containing protein, partial [Cribrihabitans sp. XS_ASV171]
AKGGTRGDVVTTTSDGRVLISQSNQVDVVSPAYSPIVVATNPPQDAVVPLPLSVLTVRFDQDMFAGDPTSTASVANAENYTITGSDGTEITPNAIVYDAANRLVLIKVANLTDDTYSLTVSGEVTSTQGLRMGTDYVTEFRAIQDLSAQIAVEFGATRYDRSLGTVSYDVQVTNIGDGDIVLPVLLLLDPKRGYSGVPGDATGQTDQGVWMIDLSESLPEGGRLEAGATTRGQTVAIVTPDRQRVQFSAGVAASTGPNRAPVLTSTPPETAKVGEAFAFTVTAEDPDGDSLIYHLLDAPSGMEIDAATGEMAWTPDDTANAEEPVTIQVFDARGAVTVQRFVLSVEGGNEAPEFLSIPSEIRAAEGELVEFEVVAADVDGDEVVIW